jgi:DivIVA domain-containing protein
MISLAAVLILAALAWGIAALLTGRDPGLEPAEPDGRSVPLPTTRPLTEEDLGAVRFDTTTRGYRMLQVDSALRRAAYDIGYKEELIGVLEAEVSALREGRLEEADALRRAREAAARPRFEDSTEAIDADLATADAAATEPSVEPVPADSVPADSVPADSVPADSALAEPAWVEPPSVESALTEPARIEPALADPARTEPDPGESAPLKRAPGKRAPAKRAPTKRAGAKRAPAKPAEGQPAEGEPAEGELAEGAAGGFKVGAGPVVGSIPQVGDLPEDRGPARPQDVADEPDDSVDDDLPEALAQPADSEK